jgi:hypothetical protein
MASEFGYTFDSMIYKNETIKAQVQSGISEQDARDFVCSRAPGSLAAEKARDPQAAWINDARADGFTFTGALWQRIDKTAVTC